MIATPKAGWLFVNWTEGDVNVSNTPQFNFTVFRNRSLKANFAKDIYSVSALPDPNDGGSISGAGSFYYGQTASLTASPNLGWSFINWINGSTVVSTDSTFTFTVVSSLNLVAKFKLTDYNINCSSYPTDAGFTSGCGIARYNQEITVSAEPNNGWKFIRWTENEVEVSTEANYTFNVKKNRNLVAVFDLSIIDERVEF
ncbi:MAG: hypothetical protein H6613_20470 [Ignavibacteriales bacterium]|nr:hypothetical protein [Ignavibacteriales bacterium]